MLASWDADASSVTTVLARESGIPPRRGSSRSAARPGSGFVRIPVVHDAEGNPLNLATIQLAAERFPD